MASKVKTTFTSNLSTSWLDRKVKQLNAASLEMATDILRQASILAPRDSGNLISSGRIEGKSGQYVVSFGGQTGGVDVPYAKRRHYENFKNPQTLLYLERAGDNVARQKSKYIRNSK